MAEVKKYLDLNGLSYYHGKLKSWVLDQLKNTDNLDWLANYYTKDEIDAIKAELVAADGVLSGRLDVVEGLWTQFLAGLPEGTVAPTLADIKTFIYETYVADKAALEASIATKVDQTAYDATVATLATKTELANEKAALAADIAKKVDQTAYDTKVAELVADIDSKVDQTAYDATVATLATKTELANEKAALAADIAKKVDQTAYDTKVAELVAADTALETKHDNYATTTDGRLDTLESQITGLTGAVHFKGVVNVLPATADSAEGDVVVYVYNADVDGSEENLNGKEYIFANGAWVELGDTTAELAAINKNAADIAALAGTHAADKAELDGKIAANAAAITALETKAGEDLADAVSDLTDAIGAVDDKVDAVTTDLADNYKVKDVVDADGASLVDADTKVFDADAWLDSRVVKIENTEIDALFADATA